MFVAAGVGFLSANEHLDQSPAYVIASAARDRMMDGHEVGLPDGYDFETLGQMCWILGSFGPPVNVSFRQAQELTQMGKELLRLHDEEAFLQYPQRYAIVALIETVERAERLWKSGEAR